MNRVLLLSAEADGPRIELMRPQLELQGFDVRVEWISDPGAAEQTLEGFEGPMVVAVVVSPSFDRGTARPFIERASRQVGTGQRLFVLDMRYHPSVVRQCRAVTRALEGLQRTLEIESLSRGGLTTSASRRAVASGSVSATSSSCADTLPLRVVHPPLLLAWPLQEQAQIVPPAVRYDVPNRAPPRSARTRPDLDPMGLSQPWRSVG